MLYDLKNGTLECTTYLDMSWLPVTNGKVSIKVEDNLLDPSLFKNEIAPKWVEEVLEVLSINTSFLQENLA